MIHTNGAISNHVTVKYLRFITDIFKIYQKSLFLCGKIENNCTSYFIGNNIYVAFFKQKTVIKME